LPLPYLPENLDFWTASQNFDEEFGIRSVGETAFWSIPEVLLMTVQKSFIEPLAALLLPKQFRDCNPFD
jgi:hypothetical protein